MTTKQWLIVYLVLIIILGIGFGSYHDHVIRNYKLETQKLHSKLLDTKKRVLELEAENSKLSISKTTVIEHTPQNTKNLSVILDRRVLVDWVLKHSLKNKISKSIAEDIVDTSMSVENGKYCLLLLALMQRESSFYIFNKSSVGALGLGQFMPATIKEMINRGVFIRYDDVFDPSKIIPAIIIWLREKGMDGKGNNLTRALYGYLGANSKGYVKDIEANIGDLYLSLVRKNKTKAKVITNKQVPN